MNEIEKKASVQMGKLLLVLSIKQHRMASSGGSMAWCRFTTMISTKATYQFWKCSYWMLEYLTKHAKLTQFLKSLGVHNLFAKLTIVFRR